MNNLFGPTQRLRSLHGFSSSTRSSRPVCGGGDAFFRSLLFCDRRKPGAGDKRNGEEDQARDAHPDRREEDRKEGVGKEDRGEEGPKGPGRAHEGKEPGGEPRSLAGGARGASQDRRLALARQQRRLCGRSGHGRRTLRKERRRFASDRLDHEAHDGVRHRRERPSDEPEASRDARRLRALARVVETSQRHGLDAQGAFADGPHEFRQPRRARARPHLSGRQEGVRREDEREGPRNRYGRRLLCGSDGLGQPQPRHGARHRAPRFGRAPL